MLVSDVVRDEVSVEDAEVLLDVLDTVLVLAEFPVAADVVDVVVVDATDEVVLVVVVVDGGGGTAM